MGDSTVYQDPDYAEVRQQSDTCLTTEDGTVFHVNSELLSRHSKFFNSLFLMGEEAGQDTMIRGIKPDIFQILLNYMSTGKVLLTSENIIDLWVATDFLMIDSLIDECTKFALRVKKRVENVVSYFITANRIKCLDLAHQCRRFVVLFFEKSVMHSMDEVCRLPYVDLIYFLSHRSLNVSDECTIWSVIEAWVQEDPADRHPLVPGLLRCLSIHEISDKLASNIISSPIIRKNTFYRDVGDPRETFDLLSDKMKAESVISFRNQLPIITKRLPRFLHVVAKLFQDRDTAELYLSYDDSLDLWRKVGDISLRGAIVFVSGHLVYYIKRFLDGRFEFTGFYYDLLRNEERSMTLPHREDYIVGEVGGSVYALQVLGTNMKRYVHETDEWVGVRRVRFHGSSALSALNVNRVLHVLYENREMNDMFMRVYDPSKDEWGRLPSPTVRRCNAESAVYHGKIFLVAGQIEVANEGHYNQDIDALLDDMEIVERAIYNIEEDERISKAVEVYDPQSNEWVMYPELPFRFSPVHVSVVKDRLYVYQDSQRPMTYWDGSGQWKIEEDPSRLFQHKFSAVKDEHTVRQIMQRNKEQDPTVWLETGLEKVIP